MATLLLPCDGSVHALLAVRHVIDGLRQDPALQVHLLNVQSPFPAYIARHLSRELRADFHREQSEAALAPAHQLLEAAGITHQLHSEVGDQVACIDAAARRLGCDRIVVGTRRKNPLVRALENSLTSRLIEQAGVPVEVIAGAQASALERIGLPAGVGVGLTLLWAATA